MLRRPTVLADPKGKVPNNVRQRYLNQFIDECLKIYPGEQDAFDRVSMLSVSSGNYKSENILLHIYGI